MVVETIPGDIFSNFKKNKKKPATDYLISLMDDGLVDPKELATNCILWLGNYQCEKLIKEYEYDTFMDED